MRLLVGLILASLAVSTVAAQVPAGPAAPPTVGGYLDDPGHPLAPGTNESIVLHPTFQPTSSNVPGVSQDQQDPTNVSTAPAHLTFSPGEVPAWVDNVSFSPPFVDVPYTPGGGSITGPPVNVILHVKKDAPAGNHQNLTVKIHSDANGPGTPEGNGISQELMLRPGIVPQVSVQKKAEGQAILKGGRWQPVTFVVTNTGNGEVTARLNVTARPQDSIVDYPPTLTLQPGQSLPVDVMLKLPWTYGESGTLELEATPMGAGDEQGKPVHEDVDIAGQSAVPGIEPLVAVAAVGLLALLRRR